MLRSFVPAVVMSCLACVAEAAPDSATVAKPPPLLVVTSRPSGISFRLSGPLTLVGRTPMTLQNGLAGRYQLETLEPGIHRWRRTIELDGTRPDSVRMMLRQKTAAGAGIRSLIVPGWGQAYDGHPVASIVFLIACAAGAGGALTLHSVYLERRDDLNAAYTAVAKKSTPASRAALADAQDRLDQARLWRGIVTTTAGGLLGLNVLDAVIRFPRFRAIRADLEFAPGPGRPGSASTHPGDLALVRVSASF